AGSQREGHAAGHRHRNKLLHGVSSPFVVNQKWFFQGRGFPCHSKFSIPHFGQYFNALKITISLQNRFFALIHQFC
ncbi:hypothetical protein, partial [uncultured Gemmiger sp.]|uniref:hypothetical protein n=1 Tax=uncultured Gemmiger sp. TaxID=1623490 RepID=UPI0025F207FA